MLTSRLQTHYDFIVCGAGTAGSVVARRLAENSDTKVLLVEAGESDEIPSVADPRLWLTNIGGPADWAFSVEPNEQLNNRALVSSMGKILGGGSSINAMIWARGHQADWDHFATVAGNESWNYSSVLEVYRGIEDWQGPADPDYRGVGGPLCVQPSPTSNAIGSTLVEAAAATGFKTFDSPNGAMMEGAGGAAITDMLISNGVRRSVFRSYTYPYMDRPNLTVLTGAYMRRVIIEGKVAAGIEVDYRGDPHRFYVRGEVVLALGAIHTAKVLMLSGIGDQSQLDRFAIPVVQHLPGVGRNLQDHVGITCVWEYPNPHPRTNTADAAMFWSSAGDYPDFFACHGPVALASRENIVRYGLPDQPSIIHGAVSHPESRGYVELTGPAPDDPVRIVDNALSRDTDLTKAIQCVEMMREVGNSNVLAEFVKREVMPGSLKGADLIHYIRDAAVSYWHQVGTASMGHDALSVVDDYLRVHGVANLRVADGSIMPRITSGNTMAPCVVIGERASAELKNAHGL
ncbi:oxidoreductase [Mycobacterium paraffinicum]|uniref:Oxidoreductase n=1 Tax=Mycobacterium paraffinicum TaxID=53378 RepID=A0A1Q4HYM1_9MYCO|nr:GMC family oxidoreductase N-terminal domain-containing protein [Mycobacterium paraffinicum]OJZ74740.1 oxidoreductase [Mycobacterium paraffinicum]